MKPAGETVGNIIADAHDHAIPLMMTTVNAGEVWYILAREVSEIGCRPEYKRHA